MLSEVSDSLFGASSIVSEASMSTPEDVEDRRSYRVGLCYTPWSSVNSTISTPILRVLLTLSL
jgi:hypothetical protein